MYDYGSYCRRSNYCRPHSIDLCDRALPRIRCNFSPNRRYAYARIPSKSFYLVSHTNYGCAYNPRACRGSSQSCHQLKKSTAWRLHDRIRNRSPCICHPPWYEEGSASLKNRTARNNDPFHRRLQTDACNKWRLRILYIHDSFHPYIRNLECDPRCIWVHRDTHQPEQHPPTAAKSLPLEAIPALRTVSFSYAALLLR